MFTALTFGLCAMVIEGLDGVMRPAIQYPAVGIGVVTGSQCRVELVFAPNTITPGIAVNGRIHRFKIGEMDSSSAVIWINEEPFNIPRPSF
jgi:hypothetical protein